MTDEQAKAITIGYFKFSLEIHDTPHEEMNLQLRRTMQDIQGALENVEDATDEEVEFIGNGALGMLYDHYLENVHDNPDYSITGV